MSEAGKVTTVERTAHSRSRDAEYATDEAGRDHSPHEHRHAAELHREAAAWQRRAHRPARAALHDEQARVHEQLAVRLAGGPDDEG